MPNCLRSIAYVLMLTLTAWVLPGASCYGQGTGPAGESALAPRVPGSPTAAAIERYTTMPISEHTGTPEISLPLLQVKSGALSVPISLSYHASGVRVDDEASWVGLGWSLNAGGVITRAVRGRADELGSGFLENYNHVPLQENLNDGAQRDSLRQIAEGNIDFEPDVFHFSFPGGGGSFVLGNDGVFHPVPHQSIGITARRVNGGLDFVLVDNAGTTYTYTTREYTTSSRRGANGPRTCSAWYLTSMVSADRTDAIHFAYDNHILNYSSSYYQTISVPQGPEEGAMCGTGMGVGSPSTSLSQNLIECQKLREITFREGRVVLVSRTGRTDLTSDRRLARVALLRTGNSDTLRQVVLYHSYFNGDLAIADPDTKRPYLRLRLDSVQTLSQAQRLPPYRLAYSGIRLPTRGKGPRDHWGHANAPYTNSPAPSADPALVPQMRVTVPIGTPGRDTNGQVLVGNTSREPNPAYVQAALLQRIGYPMGGYVVYGYEPHTAPVTKMVAPPPVTFYRSVEGVGDYGSVSDTTTLVMGNLVGTVGGTITIIRRNDLGNIFHSAGGWVKIIDLANPSGTPFQFSVTGTVANPDPNAPGGGDDVFTARLLPTLRANHTYQVIIRAKGEEFRTSVNLTWVNSAPQLQTVPRVFGGVRVKTIRTYTAPGAPVQTRYYDYDKPNTSLTSGYPLSPFAPKYDVVQIMRHGNIGTDINAICDFSGCRYLLVGSQPVGELTAGQSVNYTYVTVTDSTGANQINGQTVSHYSRYDLRGSIAKPYPAPVDLSWRRGKLERRWLYKGSESNALTLVEQQANDYGYDSTMLVVRGLRAMHHVSYSGCTLPEYLPRNSAANAALPHVAQRVAFEQTNFLGEWQYLRRSRTYRYADGSDTTRYQLTTTAYTYGNKTHAQPTQVVTAGRGWRTTVLSQYAPDYDTTTVVSPTVAAVREMARRRLHTTPLETRTVRQLADGSAVVVQGAVQVPQQVNQGVEFTKTLTWEGLQPKATGQFVASHTTGGRFTVDPGYREKEVVDRFDALNRVVQFHNVYDVPTSYLWGADKDDLLAQVQNATPAQVAFTSFEPGNSGQWQYASAGVAAGAAFTGDHRYDLAIGEVHTAAVPSGTYLVTFRYTGTGMVTLNGQAVAIPPGAGWRLGQHRLSLPATGAVTLVGAGLIDELRLCPVGAHMTSYTFRPLVGMTSQTDPTGRTTTYEYDALGRLLRTRDEQGRLLTQQEYHYARP